MPLMRLLRGRSPRSYTAVAAAAALTGAAAWSAVGPARAATRPRPVVSWSAPAAGATPPPLAFAAAAYDPDAPTSGVVLFGGVTAAGTLSNRTWIWNGSAWTEARPSVSPPARELASMAYDPALHQLILFGGQDANGDLLDDTWAWNGQSWHQQTGGTGTPGARQAAAFAYDGSGNLLLFGGTGYSVAPTTDSSPTTTVPGTRAPAAGIQTVLGDTWQWTGAGWVEASATGPPARSGATLTYDASDGTTVLFGGESTPTSSSAAEPLGDTWVWSGSKWVQARPSASPPARFGAVADYFAGLGGPLLVGGEGTSGDLDDAWLWSSGTWTQASVQGDAPAREGACGAYDGAAQEMVVFGGRGGGGGTLGDTGLVKAVASTPPPTSVPSTPPTTRARSTTTVARGSARSTTAPPTTRPRTTGPTTGSTLPRATRPGPVATPPPGGTLLLETSVRKVARGGTVWVAGGGFAPGSTITLTFHSTPSPLGSATAGPDGRFSKTVAVPGHAAPGRHEIVASGTSPAGTATELTATVMVTAPAHHRTSAFTTLFLLGLALLIPVATFLAMEASGAWRRRREPNGPAVPGGT